MQANDMDKLFLSMNDPAKGDRERENAVSRAVGALTPAQRAKLDEILSSPEKMKALLTSERAKELMKKTGKQGE